MSGHEKQREAAINWRSIYARLEHARISSEKMFELSAAEKQKVLESRAQDLAKPLRKAADEEGALDVLAFYLARERYAIERNQITEVCSMKELAQIPCTPPFVVGVINLHGQILSVIDLKKIFNLPEKGLTDLNKVIVIGDEHMELGILADEIGELASISEGTLQHSTVALNGVRASYAKGVTAEGVIVIDAKKLLSDDAIVVRQEV